MIRNHSQSDIMRVTRKRKYKQEISEEDLKKEILILFNEKNNKDHVLSAEYIARIIQNKKRKRVYVKEVKFVIMIDLDDKIKLSRRYEDRYKLATTQEDPFTFEEKEARKRRVLFAGTSDDSD